MGLMTRMLRLWKADMHGVMDQLEDKELMLKQYLREMENDLLAKQARLDQLSENERQIKRDLNHRKQELDGMENDLTLAVRKDKADIAKMLIRKRITLQSACRHLEHQHNTMEADREKLADMLNEQTARYEELKMKATTFLQQAGFRPFHPPGSDISAAFDIRTPSEEEIELELLQRQEALRQGGAA